MAYPKDETKLKHWETELSDEIAKDPVPWDFYDGHIRNVLSVYGMHLRGVAHYAQPDWRMIKAMTWVETGATISAWKTAPMQIGSNSEDPGLHDLLLTPNGKLILPAVYARTLTMKNTATDGERNIEAGVGYLLKILAIFGMVQNTASGDAGSSRHAHREHLAIVGWRDCTVEYIARHYNSGDGNYKDKLQFALDIIQGKIKPKRIPASVTVKTKHGTVPPQPAAGH